MIRLEPNPMATNRTKNRIKENNPFTFQVTNKGNEVIKDIKGKPSMLFFSLKTDWAGWLPIEEIIINHE